MQVKVTITTTLNLHHKDREAIEQAGPEQVLQTAKMQGATIHMTVDAKRRAPATKKAPQGASEGPTEEDEQEIVAEGVGG